MKNIILFTSFLIAISACNQTPTEKKPEAVDPVTEKTDLKKVIKEEQLAMKKDPVCGMVVYKFLEDTTMYKGGIYGFCGKGCKIEFMKDPEGYLHPAGAKAAKQ